MVQYYDAFDLAVSAMRLRADPVLSAWTKPATSNRSIPAFRRDCKLVKCERLMFVSLVGLAQSLFALSLLDEGFEVMALLSQLAGLLLDGEDEMSEYIRDMHEFYRTKHWKLFDSMRDFDKALLESRPELAEFVIANYQEQVLPQTEACTANCFWEVVEKFRVSSDIEIAILREALCSEKDKNDLTDTEDDPTLEPADRFSNLRNKLLRKGALRALNPGIGLAEVLCRNEQQAFIKKASTSTIGSAFDKRNKHLISRLETQNSKTQLDQTPGDRTTNNSKLLAKSSSLHGDSVERSSLDWDSGRKQPVKHAAFARVARNSKASCSSTDELANLLGPMFKELNQSRSMQPQFEADARPKPAVAQKSDQPQNQRLPMDDLFYNRIVGNIEEGSPLPIPSL